MPGAVPPAPLGAGGDATEEVGSRVRLRAALRVPHAFCERLTLRRLPDRTNSEESELARFLLRNLDWS